MPVRLLLDHNVRRAIADGLKMRGVDVLTAYEDDSHLLPDPVLLDRAAELGRLLFSQDTDLLVEAHRRQSERRSFPGVAFAHQLEVPIGRCIDDLELIAKLSTPEEVADRVHFLPL